MKNVEIIPEKSVVGVGFSCVECGKHLKADIHIPAPYFLAEKDVHYATRTDEYSYIECPKCHKTYTIQTDFSNSASSICFDDLDENAEIEISL